VRRNMRPPPREEGRIIKINHQSINHNVKRQQWSDMALSTVSESVMLVKHYLIQSAVYFILNVLMFWI